MIEHTGVTVRAGRSGLAGTPARSRAGRERKVAGKSQLLVSAIGMIVVLALLWDTDWLPAAAAFLLTVGVLEVMFQRALASFHATSRNHHARLARGGALERQEVGAAAD